MMSSSSPVEKVLVELIAPEPAKKIKLSNDQSAEPQQLPLQPHCQHFVTRKKRFCKLSVANGETYCGEHQPNTDEAAHEASYIPADKRAQRIPCPLDAKHTVYVTKLEKHLKICNAKAPAQQPAFIVTGINSGETDDNNAAAAAADDTAEPPGRLSDLPATRLDGLIAKIQHIYAEHNIADSIATLHLDHVSMDAELARDFYGPEARKHLRQTSAILGYLQHFELLAPATGFIEFGAGKGHLSYWLAQLVKTTEPPSRVLLVDRASHRHKQDNRIAERNVVHRIRADIADLAVRHVAECADAERLVGVSKHLCGAATDLAIRCLRQDERRAQGFVIALCCHHRCEWPSFVGKRFWRDCGLERSDFAIVTKLVSWAVCGSGESRETRRAKASKGQDEAVAAAATTEPNDETAAPTAAVQQRYAQAEREEIGRQCKRLLDYARVQFLRNECALDANLYYYIGTDVTLENVCIVARRMKAEERNKEC